MVCVRLLRGCTVAMVTQAPNINSTNTVPDCAAEKKSLDQANAVSQLNSGRHAMCCFVFWTPCCFILSHAVVCVLAVKTLGLTDALVHCALCIVRHLQALAATESSSAALCSSARKLWDAEFQLFRHGSFLLR